MSEVEKKLETLGLYLPVRNEPVGNYAAWRCAGDLVYVSGQTCKWNGKLIYRGRVGEDIALDDAVKAAELCALNLLLQVKAACGGNLDRLKACLKLTIFINAAAGFEDHSRLADGASGILMHCLGERGRHARAAVGSSSLPGGASVEIDGVFLRDMTPDTGIYPNLAVS